MRRKIGNENLNYRGGREAFKSHEKDRLIGLGDGLQRSNRHVEAAIRVEDLVTVIITVTVIEIGNLLGREGLGKRGN